MGDRNSFLAALRDSFGSNPLNSNAASTEGTNTLVQLGNGEVYGLSVAFNAQSTAAAFRLLDATASGIGSDVKFQVRATSTTPVHFEFLRPIRYDTGLVIAFTATGAVNSYYYNLRYSPRKTNSLG